MCLCAAYVVVRILVDGIKIRPGDTEVHYPQWPEVQTIDARAYLESSSGSAQQDYVDAVQACSQQSMHQDHTAHGHLQPATAITVPRQSVHAKKKYEGIVEASASIESPVQSSVVMEVLASHEEPWSAGITTELCEVQNLLMTWGFAVLRSNDVYMATKGGLASGMAAASLSVDDVPWVKVFNALDANGNTCLGDKQREMLAPRFGAKFSQQPATFCAVGNLILGYLGYKFGATVCPPIPRKSPLGMDVKVNNEWYRVRATILRGCDVKRPMAPQPWHCDQADYNSFDKDSRFPFVVVLAVDEEDQYRFRMSVPKMAFSGDVILRAKDILFFRGDTIHGGGSMFPQRYHIDISHSALQQFQDNTLKAYTDAEVAAHMSSRTSI